jgi:predicted SprT family Zn-dependent metalloprotease
MVKVDKSSARSMTEAHILHEAEKLCNKHLPKTMHIKISINSRLSRAMGRFMYFPSDRDWGEIEFSAKLNKVSTSAWLDTVRHEVAHAMAFQYHGEGGHGPAWVRAAKSIGCSAEVLGSLPDEAHRYQFVCKVCGHKMLAFDRLTQKMKRIGMFGKCSKCGQKVRIIDRNIRQKEAA